MAGVCTIARNEYNEIQEVLAPNQKPSILYKDIVESFNDYTYDGKEKALRVWARAYTPTFKKTFGDWELISQAKLHVNDIKGMYKDIFNNDPQRALFELAVQTSRGMRSVEAEQAFDIFGEDLVNIARELYPNAKVGTVYKPIVSRPLDPNGEPLVTSVLNLKEKGQQTKIEVASELKTMTPIALAERMANKMGLPFLLDSTMNKLGAVKGGVVFINPVNLAPDTVFHEFSHPFIETIRRQNPNLFANLSNRAKNFTYQGQNLEEFVKEKYPDLIPGTIEYNSEIIATAIGLEASMPGSVEDKVKFTAWLKTIFEKIANFINSLIEDPSQKIKPEDLDVNMTIKDLGTLMRIENKIELDPFSSNFAADQVASATATTFGSKATIDFFEQQGTKIKLEDSGDISYYTNGSIDPVTNTLRRFTRLTEFTHANFANTQRPFDPEKWLDDKTKEVFREAGADIKDKINYGQSDVPLSFDEIKAQIKKGYEESRIKGKIIHKMIEGYLKFRDINHYSDDIDKLRDEGSISEYELLWFDEKRIQRMMEQLGINSAEFNNTDIAFRDNIASELMMVNENMGVGTSNDGLIEHSDGAVSFIDYKTGAKFLADENTIRKMQYTNGLVAPVFDSKLDRAKIELVTRMIIAKMNKPDLKVRDIKIAYLSRYYGTQIRNVDVQQFLDYINNNYRIGIQELEKEVKKKPEFKEKLAQKKKEYAAMKAAKVFDFHNYQGENKIFEQDSDLKTITDPIKKEEWLKNKIANKARQSLLKDGEAGVSKDALKQIKSAVIAVLNKFKSTDISDVHAAGNKDISWFAAKTLGLRDQANAYLQSFSLLHETSIDKVTKRTNALLGEQSAFRKADRALYQEYFKRTGKTQASGAVTFSYNKGNTPLPVNQQGVFDFMYTWKDVAGENQRVGAVYTEADVISASNPNGKITQAQWDYYRESKKILKELYEGVRNKTAYINQYGQAVTYGQEYIKNDGYNYKPFTESFIPTIPFQNLEEILEKNIQSKSLNPVAITKEALLNYKDRYDMAIQNEDRFNIGIPLKYMSSDFLGNDDHSYNVTQAVDIFSRHMIQKSELDDVYDIGKATIAVMEDVTDPNNKDRKNKLKLENAVFALESHLNQHILGRRRMTLKYTRNETVNKNIDLVADGIGGFISKNAFWFAPVTAAFNGLYGLMTNTKEALIGSLSKRLFGDENAVTLSHMAKAGKISGIHQGRNLTKNSNIKRQLNEDWDGSYYKDKVNFMSKMFRLSNKNYNYTDSSLMLGVHNRVFTGDNAYVAQGLGEDLSNETLVIASMLAMKVYQTFVDKDGKAVKTYLKKDGTYTRDVNDSNIQNMWDAYELDPVTKEYTYKGPTRFLDKDGTEVKGLTTLETLKIKTYLERMYGAYSPEQKTHLERYALGRMLMKFRKFQIMNIKENFTLNSHQKYVGEYTQLFNADGSPKLKDGQPLYDWQSEAMRSRLLVFASLVGSFANVKGSKSWSEMTVEEKKQFTRFAVQLVFYGLTIALGMGAFIPPEDKDKLYAKRMVRAAEDMAQISLVDILRGTTTIDSYPTQLYKAVTSVGTLINSLLTDDIVESGPYQGDYKGWNTVEDFIPVYHATNQAVKFVSGE